MSLIWHAWGGVRILEFGVFRSESIRYLRERSPAANMIGCDILDVQPD